MRAISRGRSSAISSRRRPSVRTRGDAALLEVDRRAGEVVDDLVEVGVVADEQHALVGARRSVSSRTSSASKPPLSGACATGSRPSVSQARRGRVQRPDPRARDDELERQLERGECAAGGARLLLAARRQAPLLVRAGVVRLGLAVSQEPQLLGHRGAEPTRPSRVRTLTQLFTSGPIALGDRLAEQRRHLGTAQQRDLLPVAGDAETPVGAAQRDRQPVRGRQQRVRLDRERTTPASARTSPARRGAARRANASRSAARRAR